MLPPRDRGRGTAQAGRQGQSERARGREGERARGREGERARDREPDAQNRKETDGRTDRNLDRKEKRETRIGPRRLRPSTVRVNRVRGHRAGGERARGDACTERASEFEPLFVRNKQICCQSKKIVSRGDACAERASDGRSTNWNCPPGRTVWAARWPDLSVAASMPRAAAGAATSSGSGASPWCRGSAVTAVTAVSPTPQRLKACRRGLAQSAMSYTMLEGFGILVVPFSCLFFSVSPRQYAVTTHIETKLRVS